MRKFLRGAGLFGLVWTIIRAIWEAIGHIGNVQTLWDMISAAVQYWPGFLRATVWVAASWWFPLIASTICLMLWYFLSRSEKRFAAVTGVATQSLGSENRSAEIAAVVNDTVRILRENPGLNNFPLHALQMAGVGNLKTEDIFAEVRERIIQYGFTDPLVGLSDIYGAKTNWLQAVKWANRNHISLTTPYVFIDCIRHSNQEVSKQPE